MILIKVLVSLNAILHIWFMILEMFLWQKPIAMKSFKMTRERAKDSAVLAANQGLYNGFLAAGLIWSLITPDPAQAHSFQLFFLGCMGIAGIYGAVTASKKILFIQALPAIITLGLVIYL